MFTVEEVCEEQERQYNQLMQEDDQYCHPESFKWGFEHGLEYALTKLGWHPASELPPVNENLISELVLCWCVDSTFHTLEPKLGRVWRGEWCFKDVKWWCYPPKEDKE